MSEVVLHEAAEEEFEAAQLWHLSRSRRSAERFARSVRRVAEEALSNPTRYPAYDAEFREAGMTDYPYSLIYRALPSGDVQVIAVAHASREPGYWRDRA